MNIKPIFDDFHKFLVSIGMIGVVTGVYLIISQNIPLTDIGFKEVWNTSPGSIGIILIITGITIWYKKQKIIDISNKIKFSNILLESTSNEERKDEISIEREKLVVEGLKLLEKNKGSDNESEQNNQTYAEGTWKNE